MKYLFMLLLLTSCIGEVNTFTVGQKVCVTKGFYKGCSGIISEYQAWNFTDNVLVLSPAICNGMSFSALYVKAKDSE